MPKNEGKDSELIVRPVTEVVEFSSTDLSRLAKHVVKLHMKFVGLNVQGIRAAILCGFLLLRIKKGLPHGAFHQWIENDFEDIVGFSVRTAQRYMSKARDFIDFVHGRGAQCVTDTELDQNLDSVLLAEFVAQPKLLEVAPSSGKVDRNEWRTPQPVIDAVKSVLGTIYCDPCALPESWNTD